MAAHGWGTNNSIIDYLFDKPHRFDFYQAVRLIELLNPDKQSVGEGSDPSNEAISFHSHVHFGFPPSLIHELERKVPRKDHDEYQRYNANDDSEDIEGDEAPQADMTVNFMGLAGGMAPLPAPYAELVLERKSKKDTALKAFLDIFNHRLISMLYRVRKTYRIGFETGPPSESSFAKYIFSLIGLGTAGLQNKMPMNDRALLHYAALLAQPRSMAGLELICTDYFNATIKGHQLCGDWYPIAEDQKTEIGLTGKNNSLGVEAVLGGKIFTKQDKFELHVGPLSVDQFHDFLPTGKAFIPLCQMTRFYAGDSMEFDIVLKLNAQDVTESRLGLEYGPRLGWTSWLGTKVIKNSGVVRLSPRLINTKI